MKIKSLSKKSLKHYMVASGCCSCCCSCCCCVAITTGNRNSAGTNAPNVEVK